MTKLRNSDSKELILEAIRMAWPAVLESFFVALAGMIDTMMVSTLGTYAVAAVGLTTQPKFIALALFLSSNIAVNALAARRFGQKNRENANKILYTAIVFVIISAAIISTITFIGADQIIRWCGSNADTHEAGVTYFRVIQAGMIFNVLSLVINAAQRGCGNTQIAMTTNVTSSIVNIVFNYLLIGGNFGFPRLGMFGAALATVLGTVVACIMSIISISKSDCFLSIPYIIKHKIKPGFDAFRSIISLSFNLLLENIAMRIGFLTTSIIAAKLGTDAFAAHQVGMNLLSLAFSLGDGMQVAAVALIGRSLGEKNTEKAKHYGNICQKIGFIISVVLAVIMFFFGREIFSLFFNKADILDMGVLISRYIMVIVLFQVSQIIFAGCLRGAGDIKYCLWASLISVTIIRTLVTWSLAGGILNLGLSGIWLGVLSDQLSRFIFLSIRFKEGKWTEIAI
mgnify:FL=1